MIFFGVACADMVLLVSAIAAIYLLLFLGPIR